MLTPEQLTACTEDIVELYRQLEDSVVQKIVKAVVKGTFTEGKADLVLRLQQSGKLYDDIVKEVAKHSGLSDEAVRVLFEDASVQSMAFDNKIYKEAGIDVVNQMSPAALHVLEANIEKTGSFLKNLTKTTATASQQSFISACTLAEMQIESGAFSYTQAVRQAIHNVIADGAEVIYPSGHRDKLDVAVRRAALTGVGQTTGEISLRNAEDLGCDLMEITAHFGARPSHAEWQGKIVSISGREGYLSTADIGYGTGAGFKGWNCRHDWYPFFEGISEKAYSDKELEERKNETVTYNDKTMSRYDAEQKQRAMERQIRKERSELAALDTAVKSTDDEELKTSLKNDFDNLSVKLKSHEAKYKDFSYKTSLPPQKQRLQMYGFNRSVSQKAVHANKSSILLRTENLQYKEYLSQLKDGKVELKEKQKLLLGGLEKAGDFVQLKKKDVSLDDLAALSAYQKCEFAIFTKGKNRILLRGNYNSCNISETLSEIVLDKRWEWTGHSHPTITKLSASSADRNALKHFTWQKESSIIDLKGNTITFTSDEQEWFNELLGVK